MSDLKLQVVLAQDEDNLSNISQEGVARPASHLLDQIYVHSIA